MNHTKAALGILLKRALSNSATGRRLRRKSFDLRLFAQRVATSAGQATGYNVVRLARCPEQFTSTRHHPPMPGRGPGERNMARSAEKRGKEETKAAKKQVEKTGKPAGGARGGVTAPVTPSPELPRSSVRRIFRVARSSAKSGSTSRSMTFKTLRTAAKSMRTTSSRRSLAKSQPACSK